MGQLLEPVGELPFSQRTRGLKLAKERGAPGSAHIPVGKTAQQANLTFPEQKMRAVIQH